MYVLDMAFNVIVSAIIVIQSVFALPFNSLIFRIDEKASVFESGDGMYTVIWSTSLPGTGYVSYNYEGTEYTVWDEENAAYRTEDSVHSVRIPKEHLDNNTYTYTSQHIATRRAYVAVKGRTVSSEPVRFKGYSGQDEIHALVISDIHENPDNAEKAVSCFDVDPDLIIMNGDEVSYMTSERKFKQVLDFAYRFSGGSIPVLYTRGNHENRGEYGSDAVDIFKTTTGGMYYTCNYGPVQFICLDSGEDKKDSDWTYSGLVDYSAYVARETEWMRSLTPDESAGYKICVTHIPNIQNRYGNDWVEILDNLGVDLLVGGHKHRINFEYNKDGAPFYQMLDGGKSRDDGYIATMLTFGGGQISVLCYDNEKTIRGEFTYILNEE
ncbi:MAG: metallophosphoesterase [Clostridia bacterium]|nr:metallophosphoesterase [Clostridia bacterium]